MCLLWLVEIWIIHTRLVARLLVSWRRLEPVAGLLSICSSPQRQTSSCFKVREAFICRTKPVHGVDLEYHGRPPHVWQTSTTCQMHLNIAAVTPERYQQLTVVRLTRSMTSGYQRGCHALELHSSVLGGITGRAIDGLASNPQHAMVVGYIRYGEDDQPGWRPWRGPKGRCEGRKYRRHW